jgi:hypothetical protein
MSDLLSDKVIAKLAHQAGFRGGTLVTAVAVALAESAGHSRARGDVALEDRTWGPSVGLWQIRSLNAQRGTGGERDELANLHARTNARHAYQIYREAGRTFRPWTVYQNGMYRRFLPRAGAAVAALRSGAAPHHAPSHHAPAHHPAGHRHAAPPSHGAPRRRGGRGGGPRTAGRIVLDLTELAHFSDLLTESRDRVDDTRRVVATVAGRVAPVLSQRIDIAGLFELVTGAYGLPQTVAHLDFEVGLVRRIRQLAELADQPDGLSRAQRLEWFLNKVGWHNTLPEAAVVEALAGGGISTGKPG